jgi:predicted MFS family arabinose efflux permease
MRLVPKDSVPKALGVLYTGNAIAFAAPLGSDLGTIIGWRGVFWALTPTVLVNVIWLPVFLGVVSLGMFPSAQPSSEAWS